MASKYSNIYKQEVVSSCSETSYLSSDYNICQTDTTLSIGCKANSTSYICFTITVGIPKTDLWSLTFVVLESQKI